MVAQTEGQGRGKLCFFFFFACFQSLLLAASSILLLLLSFTDVRTNSLGFDVGLEDNNKDIEESPRPTELDGDCRGIQPRGLNNYWVLSLSSERQTLLEYPVLGVSWTPKPINLSLIYIHFYLFSSPREP